MSIERFLSNDAEESKVSELLALNRLDESSVSLQKQGKHFEALEIMERALVLRQHFFGSESNHVWEACKTISSLCNLLAMTVLQEQKFNSCFNLLKKAEILSQQDFQCQAVTFNNFACYYRRQGKLRKALLALQQAIKAEDNFDSLSYGKAETYLNLCAVLSQLGRHTSALEKAQHALILLQQERLQNENKNLDQPLNGESSQARNVVLGIAYHNVGVEQEFLNQLEPALASYTRGLKAMYNILGKNHRIIESLEASKDAVSRRLKLSQKHKLSSHLIQRSENKKKHCKNIKRKSKTKNWCKIKKAYGDLAFEIKPLSKLKLPSFVNNSTIKESRYKLQLIKNSSTFKGLTENDSKLEFGNLLSTERTLKGEIDLK